MSVLYRQCHMTKPQGEAVLHYTAWLPEQFAILGRVLKLRKDDAAWSDGWNVTFVSRTALSEDVVLKNSRSHLKQRKASDI